MKTPKEVEAYIVAVNECINICENAIPEHDRGSDDKFTQGRNQGIDYVKSQMKLLFEREL